MKSIKLLKLISRRTMFVAAFALISYRNLSPYWGGHIFGMAVLAVLLIMCAVTVMLVSKTEKEQNGAGEENR